ncbi:MAG: 3-deoxy-D-manno-octulosonic acid transferase [PVC group bacterium]|nr:3-deoxy-D-manno-octulosonic acid transferase [PVC group bacterium]
MRLILDLIYIVLAVFYLPALIFQGKHKTGFRERCGIYSEKVKAWLADEKPVIWVHAVSVGEIRAAAPLIKVLRERFPAMKILLSTITPTGNAVAHQLATAKELVIFFPFDLSQIVAKTINLFKPRFFLVMETEIWPNMISCVSTKKIPLAIVNGRISDKAFSKYKLGAWFFKLILKKIDLFCMQTELDAQRITRIGADKTKVHITGNLKFDQIVETSKHNDISIGLKKEEKLIVAGSTHDHEEEIIARVYIKLKKTIPDIRLLIAPRHPQRTADIERTLKNYNLRCVYISTIEEHLKDMKGDEIFILDTMGVLNEFYALADIVFVGGSLIPHGGHNPIEPALYAKPVIFGKHMFNFLDITRIFLKHNAAIQVEDEACLIDTFTELLTNNQKCQILAERAQELVLKNKGTSQRIMGCLEKIISNLRLG